MPETRESRRARRKRARCGAPLKNGGLCKKEPGAGTDHIGIGRCADHGGNEPEKILEASVQLGHGMSQHLLKDEPVMGTPIQMEPADALSWCVAIAAGEVRYFTNLLQRKLSHDDVVVPRQRRQREYGKGEKGHKDVTTEETSTEADVHVLIKERQKAMDRLARVSKMALDAGVAERQVSLAERQGDIIVYALEAVLGRLGITAERSPKTMARLERILPEVLLSLEDPSAIIEGVAEEVAA